MRGFSWLDMTSTTGAAASRAALRRSAKRPKRERSSHEKDHCRPPDWNVQIVHARGPAQHRPRQLDERDECENNSRYELITLHGCLVSRGNADPTTRRLAAG